MATSSTPPALHTNEPEPTPAPATPRIAGTGYLLCDFCECKLTKTGEVYQVSEKARGYRDANEKHVKAVEKLNEEITKLNAQLAAKDAEIAALKPSSASERTRGIRVR